MYYLTLFLFILMAIDGPAMAAPSIGDFYAIVNVDLMPSDQVEGKKILLNYRDEVRQNPNVRSISLIQQKDNASNHFILMETFVSEAGYRRFIESDTVRRFRTALYPHLGSPWDERLGSQP